MKWDMVKIKDVAKVTTGKTPPKSNKAYFGGDIPFITPAELGVGQYITPAKQTLTELATSVVKTVPENSTLVCCIGSLGKLAISNQPVVTNQQINTVTFKEKVFPKFGYYALAQLKPILNAIAPATTVAIVSKSKFEELKIPLPPLEEQKRIAAVLDKAHAIRQKRQQNLENADALIKSIFLDMFGDPVINPKGWEKISLNKLGDVNRGISKHRPRNAPELLGGKYPLIQTGEVANANVFINNYTATYSEEGLKQSKMWSIGTLCITIAANIAKTAILQIEACFPDSIVGFNANEKTNALFIHFWFSFFQKILEEQAPESAQKNINLALLRDLQVICPPINLQNKFADIVQKIEAQKVKQQEHLHEADQAFKALQQQFFG